MKTLKGWITTTALIAALSLTATSANAGIIVGNRSADDQKVPCGNSDMKVDWGIIVGNITGIIVGNFTGIIVGNAADMPVEKCGIN